MKNVKLNERAFGQLKLWRLYLFSANAQIKKRIVVETIDDINYMVVEIKKPCAYLFARLRAADILRPVRMYSTIRKALIEAYDIAKYLMSRLKHRVY